MNMRDLFSALGDRLKDKIPNLALRSPRSGRLEGRPQRKAFDDKRRSSFETPPLAAPQDEGQGLNSLTRSLCCSPRARLLRASPGYTLVEMLVVLTIISLILGLVGPRVLNYLGESRVKTAKLQIESFSSALDLFYIDAGRYPTAAEGLQALVERPSGVDAWSGPYVKGGRVPNDPWSHAYLYRFPVDHNPPYEVLSLGSDGQEGGAGTAADISSVER